MVMQPEPLKRQWSDYKDTRDNVPWANCTIQGKLLEYKYRQHYAGRSRGNRQEITTFSDRARLAMLKEFQTIDFEHFVSPLFITLTYPDECAEPSLDERNIHRKVMARHLERITHRHVPAAWRVEWVPRKTGTLVGVPCPHWHLLIFRHAFIDYREINLAWRKTIGCEGYVRTDIRRVDRHGVIQMYMAKYIAKDAIPPSLVYATNQNKLGRAYGWLRKDEIPRYKRHAHERLSDAQRATLTALAAEIIPWITAGLEQSFTLFGDVAQDFQKILSGMPLTGQGGDLYTDGSNGGNPAGREASR